MKTLLLLALLCVGCDMRTAHIRCMNPDGTILIDADVAVASCDKGTCWFRRDARNDYSTTTASCLITYRSVP